MTKNNLKVVKTDNKKQQELKEKNKSLEAAISQIDQNFGKGSVMRLGQQQALDVEAISTGSLSLDLALGIGGLPKGRIIEIYGPESSGKTTLARCVTKLISSDDGEVNFNGKNLNRISKKELNLIRREIQFIFQDPYASLNPRMPVNYLVTEPLHIHGEIRKKENMA